MKRITPEEVKAAYEATGLTPERSSYLSTLPDGKTKCACGMGAWAIANGAPDSLTSLAMNKWLGSHGINDDYRLGFVRGFDSLSFKSFLHRDHDKIQTGYADGKAAAALIFAEAAQ